MEIQYLGTKYGGWYLPKDIDLNEDSIVYSAGVGEDISFDLLLQTKYGSNILLIDPTERAIKHYEEVIKYFESNKSGQNFTGDIQKDYLQQIVICKPNFEKIKYDNIGLWDKEEELKFYKQKNPNYVSQSLVTNMFTNQYTIVKTNTVKQLMEKYNHDHIDLFKLDIEGAEIKTLNKMLDDEIYPKYICVEYDLYLKKKDKGGETKALQERLRENEYIEVKNDNMNATYKQI